MKSNSWRGEEARTNEVREEMSTQTVFQIGFLLNRNFFWGKVYFVLYIEGWFLFDHSMSTATSY